MGSNFVIVILRSNTSNDQLKRKIYVLLGYESRSKSKRYKRDLQSSESRKCDYSFRLQEKLIKGIKGWIVKLLCVSLIMT